MGLKGGPERDRFNRRDFLAAMGSSLTIAASRAEVVAAVQPRRSSDIVVIGAGAFGIWTALYLQRLGATVTVVDLYGAGNSRQTSGGETRGVRTSYGDRPHGRQWTE